MAEILPNDQKRYVVAISAKGLSIYDPIVIGDPVFWIPTNDLQALLDEGLRGMSVVGLPLRTRSKVVKIRVCEVLGYPVPRSFKRTQPRFPGQMFDIYIQKSNNLQVWNEELAASRRYAIIRVSATNVITQVKVVTGNTLVRLNTTKTWTSKYQACCIPGVQSAELVAVKDTERLLPFVVPNVDLGRIATPILDPAAGQILPIKTVFERLSVLVGQQFADSGADQERNRGAALHRLACETLGYRVYQDEGQFPDIRHQLLEVKLQTSPTIDLGLVTPESVEPLDVPMVSGQQIRHCDVRYGIFCGSVVNGVVTLTHFVLTTGETFFSRFPQFQGKVLNKKLQISLPADFFDI
ncbi:MAG: restriction endonuclease [Pseudomonadales bacterium]|jgi:hypothetical protein|nr:restriction endonuclease [Pseudomonadales bacterium]